MNNIIHSVLFDIDQYSEESVLRLSCVFLHQVIKTCQKMGIKSVAVHSDVDASAVSCRLFTQS